VHELQQKAFEEAGFTDIKTVDYKVELSGIWLQVADISRSFRLVVGLRIQSSPELVSLSGLR
jgi:hypothetical protein